MTPFKASHENNQPEYYIGLMTGTSIDALDIALVEIHNNQCRLINSSMQAIETDLKEQIVELCTPRQPDNTHPEGRIEQLAQLDNQLGYFFADSVIQFLQQNQLSSSDIKAIGSHGQTIRHRPVSHQPDRTGFTIQIGDPNIIAYRTGITTVSDFRRMDMAAGGEGAPLVPAFHAALMRTQEQNRIILNLGGIANITLLPKDQSLPVTGFDTGPANTLLDTYYHQHHPESYYDKDAQFAKQGKVHPQLLQRLLKDPYFQRIPPKSTGREYFSLSWLQQKLNQLTTPIETADVQHTLLMLTVQSIADAIKQLNFDDYQLYVCGGGMHNQYMLDQLSLKLNTPINPTNKLGIDGDYLEAMTFAWLAQRRLNRLTGNLPTVTGAKSGKILGAVYLP